jgi:cytoskeletal protein RodZ
MVITGGATPVSPMALSSGAVLASGGTSVTLGRSSGHAKPRSMKGLVAVLATLVVGAAAAFGWSRVANQSSAHASASSPTSTETAPPVTSPPLLAVTTAAPTTAPDSAAPAPSSAHLAPPRPQVGGGPVAVPVTVKPPASSKPSATAAGDPFLPDERK